jgi:hypothetical protein
MVVPSAIRPGAGFSGGSSSTNFSPSRLVVRTRACASGGNATSPLTATVTSAVQSGPTAMSVTVPTDTSATFTSDCGTRSTTSVNSMVSR